jgi:hypothetical protein
LNSGPGNQQTEAKVLQWSGSALLIGGKQPRIRLFLSSAVLKVHSESAGWDVALVVECCHHLAGLIVLGR